MKRSIRIALVVGAVTILISPVLAFPFYDKIVPVLGPVLPRPQAVPSKAATSYSFKEGIGWNWARRLRLGCAEWIATDRFASVRLVRGVKGCTSTGKIVDYNSFAEEIVFNAGGGNSPNGTWLGGKPCPYIVPPQEIHAFGELAREAHEAAQTEAEKAILRQVQDRLAKVDGDELTTDHTGGCNDLKVADYGGPLRPHVDVWNPR